MGNLYCRLEPTANGGSRSSSARISTRCRPRARSSRSSRTGSSGTRGGTILGADNKSAVAAMLEAARRVLAENRPHAGHRAPLHAEGGGRALGAAAFDHERLAARLGYVYDQAAPIGEVILGAPHAQSIGPLPRPRRARRACTRRTAAPRSPPPRARSPTCGSAGVDEETTANVGHDPGGTAGNIVPEWCIVRRRGAVARRAQARRPRPGDARRVRLRGRALAECEVETKVDEELPRLPLPARRPRGAARRATRSSGPATSRAYGALGRRRGRERLQRARAAVRQPRERDDRHPHARRADRGRGSRSGWST